MQRLLQVLFFITIISAVFASSAGPNGCQEGKVWTTAFSTQCLRRECHNNEISTIEIPQPCEEEGAAYKFFTYPEVVEPPSGKLFEGLTDDPLNPYTGTTPPALVVEYRTVPAPAIRVPPKKSYPHAY